MISDRCDFNEFVLKAKGRDYHDIIYLADREATEAERRFYHSSAPDQDQALCGQGYAKSLKSFIVFMRHGIKTHGINHDDLLLMDDIRKQALQKNRTLATHH